MEITHKNSQYVLNVEQAIKLGVLSPKNVTARAGDVFTCNGGKVILVQSHHMSNYFTLLGLNDAFAPYSNEPIASDEVFDKMREWGYTYVGNMTVSFTKALNEFVKNTP